MATYNTAFGSLPGYKEMMGTTNTTAGGEEKPPTVYGGQTQTQRTTQQPAQTFAQMQQRGVARPPAPTGPTATAFGQYGGSQQGQQLRSQLQQRLTEFGQAPSRYDTQAFQQIRGAQAANLQSEYGAQQKALNEDLARRGLSASSIGGGRMGDLAGQQARALSSLDAQLLQQAADTQAQDRAQFMQSGQGLAELAGSQDLAQFEANRVAQAATFENQLRAAQFGQQQYEQAGQEAFQGAQAEEAASQAARQFDLSALGQTAGLSLDLQRLLGTQEAERAGLTGQFGGVQTLAGQQQAEQRRQFDIQQRLQEQLGLGGLDVQRGELGVRQQSLQQQATDAAAERALRETLQTRELTAAERQQLTDITSRRELQTQQIGAASAESALERNLRERLQSGQITAEEARQERQIASEQALQSERLIEQGRQFGLQLNETQANRLQQYGISTQELGLRSQQVQQEGAIEGRRLSVVEAQNIAQNGLEQQRITQQGSQFGLQLSEQQAARIQQGGFTVTQLAQEAQRIQNQAYQFNTQMTVQGLQNTALNNLEQQRITNQQSQYGSTFAEQVAARLGQQGIQQQQVDVSRTAAQADARLAENQFMMQLASMLGNLTPDQFRVIVNQGITGGGSTGGSAGSGATGGSVGGGGGSTGGGFGGGGTIDEGGNYGNTFYPPAAVTYSTPPAGLPAVPVGDSRYFGYSARAADGKTYQWNGAFYTVIPDEPDYSSSPVEE